MPGITLHFHLAQRGLEHLRASGSRLPFDPHDPVALNAYLNGAIGPDLGYLPGGVRRLSDLAHCERTGVLSSELIRSARTPVERAFAWGWLTHVLADRMIHPWIGRGVGELLTGCRKIFVSGSSDPLSHLRVEIGVDCWFAARHRDARSVRLRPAFDSLSIGFLQDAFARTYGETLPRDWFLDSHRSAGRRAGQALVSLRIVAALMDDAVWRFSLPGARWLLGRAYRSATLRGLSLAYLNPVAPPDWLLEEIERSAHDVCAGLREAVETGGDDVGDYHLDTGWPLDPRPSQVEAELAGAA